MLGRLEQRAKGNLERVREAAQGAYREVVRARLDALEVAGGDAQALRQLLLSQPGACPQLSDLPPKVGEH